MQKIHDMLLLANVCTLSMKREQCVADPSHGIEHVVAMMRQMKHVMAEPHTCGPTC